MSFRAMQIGSLKQIRKPEAFQRFKEGKPIVIAGNNQNPVGIMGGHTLNEKSIEEWKHQAGCYGPDDIRPNEQLWKGDRDTTAWELMMNNFMFYLEPELGRYAVYYVDSNWN